MYLAEQLNVDKYYDFFLTSYNLFKGINKKGYNLQLSLATIQLHFFKRNFKLAEELITGFPQQYDAKNGAKELLEFYKNLIEIEKGHLNYIKKGKELLHEKDDIVFIEAIEKMFNDEVVDFVPANNLQQLIYHYFKMKYAISQDKIASATASAKTIENFNENLYFVQEANHFLKGENNDRT
ncbi:hypothetical protein Sp14A_09810 [Streptococcus pluranimalium]|uniref:Uncharacterized protein n=2 Tax=Streptococcus pluranimalium TaxID=82348 RepID=A0A345VJK0_9STRE|nr:hypothetical protein Sp14A_09810 [Streptococcus pluranimalium]